MRSRKRAMTSLRPGRRAARGRAASGGSKECTTSLSVSSSAVPVAVQVRLLHQTEHLGDALDGLPYRVEGGDCAEHLVGVGQQGLQLHRVGLVLFGFLLGLFEELAQRSEEHTSELQSPCNL